MDTERGDFNLKSPLSVCNNLWHEASRYPNNVNQGLKVPKVKEKPLIYYCYTLILSKAFVVSIVISIYDLSFKVGYFV